MNNKLTLIKKYFPTGTTEGEKHILPDAFVHIDEYSEIITPQPSSPKLLIGKKGSGKSAIIDFTQRLMQNSSVPALILKPINFGKISFENNGSVGEHTRVAYDALVQTIASEIGAQLPCVIFNASDTQLYESALRDGTREKSYLRKVIDILPKLAKPFVQVDLSGIFTDSQSASAESLVSALKDSTSMTDTLFYLFIDDVDQVASPNVEGHLNRIWGVLLAAREFTQQLPQLRCIITLREEVWRRLSHDKAGQRDQTDHFASLIYYLNPSLKHIQSIIERRLELAAGELVEPHPGNNYLVFFEAKGAKMPMSDETRSWKDLILLRSRERPRDAIQLIHALADAALKRRIDKISELCLSDVMPKYSEQRTTYLSQEVEEECPQILAIMRALADIEFDYGSFKATTENVKRFLVSLSSRFSIQVYGVTLQEDEGSAFLIWRFLYDNGVLNARVADNTADDGFSHIQPSADPTLVSVTRWNDMQKVIWEINPTYRDYLIKLQAEKRTQIGLPPLKKKRS